MKKDKINVIFLGCTKFSESVLLELQKWDFVSLSAVITIPQKFAISYSKDLVTNSNYSDLSCVLNSETPIYEIDTIGGKRIVDLYETIKDKSPDVFLVMGWYHMIPKKIRDLARYNAWGIHASLLPNYAGGAPLVWAIIEGEEKTGVTLFRLDNGIDDGDIIAQREFDIEKEDTIKEVYEKATKATKEILYLALNNIENTIFIPQRKDLAKIFPQRKPEDGEINLLWDSKRIYDFIRAQSSPYPGAFLRTIDGGKIYIEKARMQ